jgi:hypothetical protein
VGLREHAGTEPFVTEAQATQTVRLASEIWEKACGISFVPVRHFERDAEADGVAYRAQHDTELRDLRYKYAHINYVTVVFTTLLQHKPGDDYIGGNASYPRWDRTAVLMSQAKAQIFAHEMGHYLNLPHVADDGWDETRENDPFNLMFPGDFPENVERNLQPVQCAEAKRYLLGFAHLRELCRPDAADPELSKTNCPVINGF